MTTPSSKVGPITRFALLGVVFGIVSCVCWALATGLEPARGALIGFAGGLAGGSAVGVLIQMRTRRR